MASDMNRLLKALKDQGFEVTRTRSGNRYTVRRNGVRVATISTSTGDYRSMRNAIAQAKAAGYTHWA